MGIKGQAIGVQARAPIGIPTYPKGGSEVLFKLYLWEVLRGLANDPGGRVLSEMGFPKIRGTF